MGEVIADGELDPDRRPVVADISDYSGEEDTGAGRAGV